MENVVHLKQELRSRDRPRSNLPDYLLKLASLAEQMHAKGVAVDRSSQFLATVLDGPDCHGLHGQLSGQLAEIHDRLLKISADLLNAKTSLQRSGYLMPDEAGATKRRSIS
jgi:hypothetical protein